MYKFLKVLLRSLKNLSTENFMSESFCFENPFRQPAYNKLNLVKINNKENMFRRAISSLPEI